MAGGARGRLSALRGALLCCAWVTSVGAVTQVCKPYAQNTGPSLIAVAWDGNDPTLTPPADGCDVTDAAGYRAVLTKSGTTQTKTVSTGATTLEASVTGLTALTRYVVYVFATDGAGAEIAGSRSVSVTIQTEALISGEVKSFGLIATQQCVLRQLRFFENSFPFTMQSTFDSENRQRLTLSAGVSTSAVEIMHLAQDGTTLFQGDVTMGARSGVGPAVAVESGGSFRVGSTLTADDGEGSLVFAGGVIDASNATGEVRFGPSAVMDTASGALTITSVRASSGGATLSLTADGAALSGSSSVITLAKEGASAALSIVLDAIASEAMPSGTVLDVASSALDIGTVRAADAGVGLALEGVATISPASGGSVTFASGAGEEVVIQPDLGRVSARDLAADVLSVDRVTNLTLVEFAAGASGTSIRNVRDMPDVHALSARALEVTASLTVEAGATVGLGPDVAVDTTAGTATALGLVATSADGLATLSVRSSGVNVAGDADAVEFSKEGAAPGVVIRPGEGRVEATAVAASSVSSPVLANVTQLSFDADASTAVRNLDLIDGLGTLNVGAIEATASLAVSAGATLTFGDGARVDTVEGTVFAASAVVGDAISFTAAGAEVGSGNNFTFSAGVPGSEFNVTISPGEGSVTANRVFAPLVSASTIAVASEIAFDASGAGAIRNAREIAGVSTLGAVNVTARSLTVEAGGAAAVGELIRMDAPSGNIAARSLSVASGGASLGVDERSISVGAQGTLSIVVEGGDASVGVFIEPAAGALNASTLSAATVVADAAQGLSRVSFRAAASGVIENLHTMRGAADISSDAVQVLYDLRVDTGAQVALGGLAAVDTSAGEFVGQSLRVNSSTGASFVVLDAAGLRTSTDDANISFTSAAGGDDQGVVIVPSQGALYATDVTSVRVAADSVTNVATLVFNGTGSSVSNLEAIDDLGSLRAGDVHVSASLRVAADATVDLGDSASVNAATGRISAVEVALGGGSSSLVLGGSELVLSADTERLDVRRSGSGLSVSVYPGQGRVDATEVRAASAAVAAVRNVTLIDFDPTSDSSIRNVGNITGVSSVDTDAILVRGKLRVEAGASAVEFGDSLSISPADGSIAAVNVSLNGDLVLTDGGVVLADAVPAYAVSKANEVNTFTVTYGGGVAGSAGGPVLDVSTTKLYIETLTQRDDATGLTLTGLVQVTAGGDGNITFGSAGAVSIAPEAGELRVPTLHVQDLAASAITSTASMRFSSAHGPTSITGLDTISGLSELNTSKLVVAEGLSVDDGAAVALGTRVSVNTTAGALAASTLRAAGSPGGDDAYIQLGAAAVELGPALEEMTFERPGVANSFALRYGAGAGAHVGPLLDVSNNSLAVATVTAADGAAGLDLDKVSRVTFQDELVFSEYGAASDTLSLEASSSGALTNSLLTFKTDRSEIAMGALNISASTAASSYVLSGLTHFEMGTMALSVDASSGAARLDGLQTLAVRGDGVGAAVLSADTSSGVARVGASVSLNASAGSIAALAVAADTMSVGAVGLFPGSGPELRVADADGTRLVVSFNESDDGRGSGRPTLNARSNSLAVGTISPSNAQDALQIERLGRVSADGEIVIAATGAGDEGIIVNPGERAFRAVRSVLFDASSGDALNLTLGGVSATREGGVSELVVGGAFSASSSGEVTMGPRIVVNTSLGEVSVSTLLATEAVLADLSVGISGAGDLDNASAVATYMAHEYFQVSNGTSMVPGSVTIGDGALSVGLCAGSENCAQPSLVSSTGTLALRPSGTNATVSFRAADTEFFTDVRANLIYGTRAESEEGSYTVAAAVTGEVKLSVGGATMVEATSTQVNLKAPVEVTGMLRTSGRVEVGGRLEVDGGMKMQAEDVFTGNNFVSDPYHPLKLESNYRTGVKIKVTGDEIVLVTSNGVFVNGTLEARDGILSPSVTSTQDELTLSALASVAFNVNNVSVGRVSSGGFEVEPGRNITAPDGSFLMFGDMPLYADNTGNWAGSTPVLHLAGATSSGSSLTVSGDLQIERNVLIQGDAYVAGDVILLDPINQSHPDNQTADASVACDKGAVRWDDDFLYVCVALGGTSNWKRVSLTSY